MGAHTHVCIHVCAYIQLIVSQTDPAPNDYPAIFHLLKRITEYVLISVPYAIVY